MSNRADISSTEKLLNVIRSNKKIGDQSEEQVVDFSRRGHFGSFLSLPSWFYFRKKTIFGVVIGQKSCDLAKITHHSSSHSELLGLSSFSVDSQLGHEDTGNIRNIKSCIRKICEVSKSAEIWCTLPMGSVEFSYLRIPDVPRSQRDNAVYWTFRKKVQFDEAKMIFDYDDLGPIAEDGIRKRQIMAYIVPKRDVAYLKNLFKSCGCALGGITTIPFAYQNFFRKQWLAINQNSICILLVGADSSRIDIFVEGNLVLSREFRTGLESMLQLLEETLFSGRNEAQAQARLLLDRYLGSTDGEDLSPGDIYPAEDVFLSIVPVVDRLVRQVERTFEHFFAQFHSVNIGALYLLGALQTNSEIRQHIGEQLGIQCLALDPFKTDDPLSTRFISAKKYDNSESYTSAIGVALSDNIFTPNFLFTAKQKEFARKAKLFNKSLLTTSLLLLITFLGFNYNQSKELEIQENKISQLQDEVAGLSIFVDQELILELVSKVSAKQKSLRVFKEKYFSLAVLNEISHLTPKIIQIVSITAELRGNTAERSLAVGAPKNIGAKKLIIDAIILGDRTDFETKLTSFLLLIKKSLLFEEAAVQKKFYELYEGKEVMRFNLEITLV